MTCQRLIRRVAGDLGPPITVEQRQIDVTGWTITARFTGPNGQQYTLPAVITATGDGADVAAEYHFDFAAGDLVAGDHLFDFHYSHASIDDYSWPDDRFVMRVRDAR